MLTVDICPVGSWYSMVKICFFSSSPCNVSVLQPLLRGSVEEPFSIPFLCALCRLSARPTTHLTICVISSVCFSRFRTWFSRVVDWLIFAHHVAFQGRKIGHHHQSLLGFPVSFLSPPPLGHVAMKLCPFPCSVTAGKHFTSLCLFC